MRRGLLTVVASWALAGCGLAPPIDCGEEDAQPMEPPNTVGRQCLADAWAEGRPATFVIHLTDTEGQSVDRTLGVVGTRQLQVTVDGTEMTCALVPVAEWNATHPDPFEAAWVFVEDACEPVAE